MTLSADNDHDGIVKNTTQPRALSRVRKYARSATCLCLSMLPVGVLFAQGNPCEDPAIHRLIGEPDRKSYYHLYDGAEKFRIAPPKRIEFPKEIPAEYEPTCVVYAVEFDGAGMMKATPAPRPYAYGRKPHDPKKPSKPNSGPALDVYTGAGLAVLPFIVNGGFIHNKPTPHSSTLIAVPLWREHPLYAGAKENHIWQGDLREMGYADAKKLADRKGIAIYEVWRWPTTFDGFSRTKISTSPQQASRQRSRGERTFVAIREFKPAEQIVPNNEELIAWLTEHIAPHLSFPTSGQGVSFQLRVYARGVRYEPIGENERLHEGGLPQQSNLWWFPWPALDPLIREPVERPVAIIEAGAWPDRVTSKLQWNVRSQLPEFNSLEQIEKQAHKYDDKRRDYIARQEQYMKG